MDVLGKPLGSMSFPSLISFLCPYFVNFEHIYTYCCGVSIFDFEQAIAGWLSAMTSRRNIFERNNALKVSVFGVLLVRFFRHLDWIPRFTLQISLCSLNPRKYVPEKRWIRTHFKQRNFALSLTLCASFCKKPLTIFAENSIKAKCSCDYSAPKLPHIGILCLL